ncbi:MAG: patatin-like phospholipase family protein [Puniceicoccales bacterium]|jgi:predicted acylesterase/phospholipase RssA|nr:patatin-like phospholipase family protein [Puniceicoccales bacterium]
MQRILANPIVQNVGKLIGEAADSLQDQSIEEIPHNRKICSANERCGGALEIPPQRTASKEFVEWDAAIIKANRNGNYAKLDVCGQRLSKSLKDLNCFYMLACNVLAQKLGHQLSESERDEVFQCAWQMFSNSKVGTREKLMCMDTCIDEIVRRNKPIEQCCKQPPLLNLLNGEIVLTKAAEIENLVLSGGGLKCVGEIVAYEELEKAGLLKNLKNICGTSGGALVAISIAIGISPKEAFPLIGEVLKAKNKSDAEVRPSYASDHPMFSMLDSDVDEVPVANNRLVKMISAINLPALGVVELLDRKSAEVVAQVLQRLDLDSFALKLTDGERRRLKLLRNPSFGSNRTEEQMITFGDLRILAKLNISSNPFKNLIITGWDATHRRVLYFNAENTPDAPIAYAGRISASIPMIFKSPCLHLTKFGGRYAQPTEGLSGKAKLFDGGLVSNASVEIFIKGEEGSAKRQSQQQSTLTCIFDENGSGHQATSKRRGFQRSKNTLKKILKDSVLAFVYKESKANVSLADYFAENRKLDDTSNIMILGHGPLETFSFNASSEEIEAAKMSARASARQWILQHEHQCAQIKVCSMPDKEVSWKQLTSMPDQLEVVKGEMREAACCLSSCELQDIIYQQFEEESLNCVWQEICEEENLKRAFA